MKHGKASITVLGFDDNCKAGGIPRKDQIHTAIFGEVGSGKSTVNTILINQNITRGEGFLVLDPHGSLAQDVIRMIPDAEKDRLVYISLDSVARWGRTVKINPLEVREAGDRYPVAMNLVSALRNIYRDSWGPQLEMILRNAANALVEIEGSTLRDMVRMITDPRMRQVYLSSVANPDVRHFWSALYEQYYQKDAGRAAYNKLDKILATPQVAAMLDTPRSTLDWGDAMESGKWIVVDLSTGGSDDVVSFVGTILVNMVYVEAKKRFGSDHRPFFMHIDEAHLFAPFALRELLNTMRKANVKVAITSQTINTFPREFAREVSALARTIVCFKVDTETANTFKTVMPVSVDTLTSLSHGRFAFYSQGNPQASGLLKASPIVDRKREWIELAGYSAIKYGEPTSLERYILPTKTEEAWPQVLPLEAAILILLYNENRDLTRDEICDIMQKMFDIQKREIFERLENILVNKLRIVEKKTPKGGDGDANPVTRYTLSDLAYNSFFSHAAQGRRAGSDLHLGTIFLIMEMQLRSFKFCIPDLGDRGEQRPDLLVFGPQRMQNSGYKVLFDPYQWSDKVIAIEVETDPTKHGLQVARNFQKNFDLGYDVWFVVFSAKHMQYIIDTLGKNGIERQLYRITVVPPESVQRLANTQNGSVTHLTREELEVYNALGHGRTARSVAEIVGLSSYDVIGILWKLEQKGMAERGYVETKKTEYVSGSTIETKRQEYFMPTEEGKKLADKGEPVIPLPWQGMDIEFITAKPQDSHPKRDLQTQNKPRITEEQVSQGLANMIDFSKLTDEQLKAFVTVPQLSRFATQMLENRGFYVRVKGGKVKLRRRN